MPNRTLHLSESPVVIKGKKACPPEDCGGIWGYADFLDAIQYPKHEDEEREFWATQSPLDCFGVGNFKRASFPNLKPSLKSISIRLPEDMIAELKIIANKKDAPYQSLAKIYLARQIALERSPSSISPKNKASH